LVKVLANIYLAIKEVTEGQGSRIQKYSGRFQKIHVGGRYETSDISFNLKSLYMY